MYDHVWLVSYINVLETFSAQSGMHIIGKAEHFPQHTICLKCYSFWGKKEKQLVLIFECSDNIHGDFHNFVVIPTPMTHRGYICT